MKDDNPDNDVEEAKMVAELISMGKGSRIEDHNQNKLLRHANTTTIQAHLEILAVENEE